MMEIHIRDVSVSIIDKYNLSTISDLLNIIPKTMCHVLQESDVFETYSPDIVRLKFPKEKWEFYLNRYAYYRDNIIRKTKIITYLEAILNADERLPCFCSEMTDVAGILYTIMSNQTVYSLRNIYVNYLYLPQRWHCINAVVESNRIRYFDISAYAQVFDRKRRKFVHPKDLEGFDATDIDFNFIESSKWLQNKPFQRRITLQNQKIEDNFCPAPSDEFAEDEFLRTYDALRIM